MRLMTYMIHKVGPMFPFLLVVSIIGWGIILTILVRMLFARNRDFEREFVILEWVPGIAIIFGILGTLIGLSGVFPHITPGNPAASLGIILGGLGHALNSSVCGLAIAAVGEMGILMIKWSRRKNE